MIDKKPKRFRQIIFGQLRQVKRNLFFALLCMLGFTLAELLVPWPLKIIFDHILSDKPLSPALSFAEDFLQNRKSASLVLASLAIFFIALFRGLFSYGRLYLTSRIGIQIVYALRKALFLHLQKLSLSFHNRTRSGELLTKVTADTQVLKDIFAESVLLFLSDLLTIAGMITIMLMVNWRLSLIVLATFPLLAYTLFYLFGTVKASARKQRRREGKMASRLNEMLTAVPLIQAFGTEQYEAERFEVESDQTLQESLRTAKMGAAATRLVEVIGAAGLSAAVLFGSILALKGEITPGEVLVFASYLTSMYKPMRNLAKLSTRFSRAAVSAERIGGILETAPEIQDEPNAFEAARLKGEIVFKGVSFDYGDGRGVLKEVSFAISPGQRVALVGASGAGKSTIVNLILRLYDPHAGEILIDGVNLRQYQRASLRREIGIVLQDTLLFGATLRENIAYGKPDAAPEEIEEAARQAHAHDFITALPKGYDTVLGERGSTLSGGQRQRICLARAIIKQPSILILDEPTSAVDAESERMIWETVRRLQHGKTLLVIAHQFSSIKGFDQILALKNGEIMERGSHEELIHREGYYYELFHLQGS
jgi:ABC-type multidrug transport system fused ATPase/permease subunit